MVFDELILRSLRGDMSPSEAKELLAWRRTSPEHERRYQQLVHLWAIRDLVAPPTDARRPSAKDLVSRVPSSPASAGAKRGRSRWSFWSAAAMTAASVVGLIYMMQGARPVGSVDSPSPIDLVTDAEEQSTVRLGDGTVVRLAGESRLRVGGSERGREAWLDGRAFFAVAHDTIRPFVVRMPMGEVQVKGTRFDLEYRDGRVRVAVLDGLVELRAGGGTVPVRPGDVGEVRVDGDVRVRRAEDVYGRLDWMGDFIAFEATALPTVVEELQRRYGLDIRILDEALAERSVTIWSMDRSPAEIVEVICRTVQAACTERDGVVTMS